MVVSFEGRIYKADGYWEDLDLRNMCEFAHTMVGRKRLDNIQDCLAAVKEDNIPGDVAETGAWRADQLIYMKGCLTAWGMEDRLTQGSPTALKVFLCPHCRRMYL